MLLETSHDSAPARLHSRAQLLCIFCAGLANRSKCRLTTGQRGLGRYGGAENEQHSQTSHSQPRLNTPIKKSRSACAELLITVSAEISFFGTGSTELYRSRGRLRGQQNVYPESQRLRTGTDTCSPANSDRRDENICAKKQIPPPLLAGVFCAFSEGRAQNAVLRSE
jgi:hypothetical protein